MLPLEGGGIPWGNHGYRMKSHFSHPLEPWDRIFYFLSVFWTCVPLWTSNPKFSHWSPSGLSISLCFSSTLVFQEATGHPQHASREAAPSSLPPSKLPHLTETWKTASKLRLSSLQPFSLTLRVIPRRGHWSCSTACPLVGTPSRSSWCPAPLPTCFSILRVSNLTQSWSQRKCWVISC